MPWIRNENSASRCIYNAEVFEDVDDVDDPVADLPGDERGVVWNDSGTAQVTAEVAEALVAEYDSISYTN
jgi:hypothetical protein